jgi:hypothetical protein
MRELLTMACEEVKVFALGVVEIELVNLTLLKRIQEQTNVEKRKLHVLCDLITPTELEGLVVRNAEGTKGGNETLRYKAGFGRDLSEDLDAKMFKGSKTGKRDRGGETLEDERSLTVGEVAFLNEAYERLMTLRRDRRGYLIRAGK